MNLLIRYEFIKKKIQFENLSKIMKRRFDSLSRSCSLEDPPVLTNVQSVNIFGLAEIIYLCIHLWAPLGAKKRLKFKQLYHHRFFCPDSAACKTPLVVTNCQSDQLAVNHFNGVVNGHLVTRDNGAMQGVAQNHHWPMTILQDAAS